MEQPAYQTVHIAGVTLVLLYIPLLIRCMATLRRAWKQQRSCVKWQSVTLASLLVVVSAASMVAYTLSVSLRALLLVHRTPAKITNSVTAGFMFGLATCASYSTVLTWLEVAFTLFSRVRMNTAVSVNRPRWVIRGVGAIVVVSTLAVTLMSRFDLIAIIVAPFNILLVALMWTGFARLQKLLGDTDQPIFFGRGRSSGRSGGSGRGGRGAAVAPANGGSGGKQGRRRSSALARRNLRRSPAVMAILHRMGSTGRWLAVLLIAQTVLMGLYFIAERVINNLPLGKAVGYLGVFPVTAATLLIIARYADSVMSEIDVESGLIRPWPKNPPKIRSAPSRSKSGAPRSAGHDPQDSNDGSTAQHARPQRADEVLGTTTLTFVLVLHSFLEYSEALLGPGLDADTETLEPPSSERQEEHKALLRDDTYVPGRRTPSSADEKKDTHGQSNSIKDIFSFFTDTFNEVADLSIAVSPECLIMALIYLSRLMVVGRIQLRSDNWRLPALMSIFLAQKIWDDETQMERSDFGAILRKVFKKGDHEEDGHGGSQGGSQGSSPVKFAAAQIGYIEQAYLNLIEGKLNITSRLYRQYYNELFALVGEGAVNFPAMLSKKELAILARRSANHEELCTAEMASAGGHKEARHSFNYSILSSTAVGSLLESHSKSSPQCSGEEIRRQEPT
jgi:hypothetical protein